MKKVEVVFHSKKITLSFILKIEAFFHIFFYKCLKSLSGMDCGWVGRVVQLITLSTPTRVEVELGYGCGWAVTIFNVNSDELPLHDQGTL